MRFNEYAKKDCRFCDGFGEVRVPDRMWQVTAVCSCVRDWRRPLTEAAMLRAAALRRSGLAR